ADQSVKWSVPSRHTKVSAPGWLRRINSPNTDLHSLSQITQCGAIALPGTIGILCAAMARLCGAEVALVGLESDRHRLNIAEENYGCQGIIGDPTNWANERDGMGCDGVIDAAGSSVTLEIAMQVVRPAGWISKVGWGPQPLGYNLDPLVQKNVTLQGSFSHNWPIWERVLALLTSGQLNVAPIIGGIWPIDQWQTAFEKMHRGEVVKSVLQPI
ncbi:zinc-binding dehydrogenase, partial [Rhodopirellula bahusiensis]